MAPPGVDDAQDADMGTVQPAQRRADIIALGWTPPDGIDVPKWRC